MLHSHSQPGAGQWDTYLPHPCHVEKASLSLSLYSHPPPVCSFFSPSSSSLSLHLLSCCNMSQPPSHRFQLLSHLVKATTSEQVQWQEASCSTLCSSSACVCETRPVNDFTPLNLCYSFFTPVSQQHSTSLSLCKVSYKYVNDGMLMSQDCSLKSGGASDVGTARQDFGIRVCVCVFYYYLPI